MRPLQNLYPESERLGRIRAELSVIAFKSGLDASGRDASMAADIECQAQVAMLLLEQPPIGFDPVPLLAAASESMVAQNAAWFVNQGPSIIGHPVTLFFAEAERRATGNSWAWMPCPAHPGDGIFHVVLDERRTLHVVTGVAPDLKIRGSGGAGDLAGKRC